MMHIHTLALVLPGGDVFCRDCPVEFRLATYDEAVWVHETGVFAPDGPLLLNGNGVIVVPKDFSLFQEA